ncbi:MAG: glutathione S-transferase N-terminal domain-containing protein [Candidatus Thiodiazotropha sp. (ex Dulcina madagascariensis)]|nr:glutathione S-transferase N-terminal domain-containing protein [Candidatus Thiodiazotropha sp. (ex Dulcina madagascariensis)]MCU7925959.1 glutathione S-transferase N-terminal domain-containing protein [Candidatus Thiodiazotropha sp. (ex Dulcina madagascariensis)]
MSFRLFGLFTLPVRRTPERQRQVNQETSRLALYHFPLCPYCLKVSRDIRRLNLRIERRNVFRWDNWADELRREGGKLQTPCLKIRHDDRVEWLYESDEILRFLEQHFAEVEDTQAA